MSNVEGFPLATPHHAWRGQTATMQSHPQPHTSLLRHVVIVARFWVKKFSFSPLLACLGPYLEAQGYNMVIPSVVCKGPCETQTQSLICKTTISRAHPPLCQTLGRWGPFQVLKAKPSLHLLRAMSQLLLKLSSAKLKHHRRDGTEQTGTQGWPQEELSARKPASPLTTFQNRRNYQFTRV